MHSFAPKNPSQTNQRSLLPKLKLSNLAFERTIFAFFLVSSILVMHVNTVMGVCSAPYTILPLCTMNNVISLKLILS